MPLKGLNPRNYAQSKLGQDLHEDVLAILDRGSLSHRSQRVRNPSLLADDLAEIVFSYGYLECDRVSLIDLIHLNGVSIIDESLN